jgi:hypothetical protein
MEHEEREVKRGKGHDGVEADGGGSQGSPLPKLKMDGKFVYR